MIAPTTHYLPTTDLVILSWHADHVLTGSSVVELTPTDGASSVPDELGPGRADYATQRVCGATAARSPVRSGTHSTSPRSRGMHSRENLRQARTCATAPHKKSSRLNFVLDTIGNRARRAVQNSSTIMRRTDDADAGVHFEATRGFAGAAATDRAPSSILESHKTWCYKGI